MAGEIKGPGGGSQPALGRQASIKPQANKKSLAVDFATKFGAVDFGRKFGASDSPSTPQSADMAANGRYFSESHWRAIAQGSQTETWLNDGQVVGVGGIRNPQPTDLPTGHYFCRFASSNSSRAAQLGGGWWLDSENYRKIETFARQRGYSIHDAARLVFALPYAWTRVDLLIRAILVAPMKAYAGEGKPPQGARDSTERSSNWLLPQCARVCQLYIPGLFVMGASPGEQLYERVFSGVVSQRLV